MPIAVLKEYKARDVAETGSATKGGGVAATTGAGVGGGWGGGRYHQVGVHTQGKAHTETVSEREGLGLVCPVMHVTPDNY
jgi:hypothetical protein